MLTRTMKPILGVLMALALLIGIAVPATIVHAVVTAVNITSPTTAAPAVINLATGANVSIEFTVTAGVAGQGDIRIEVGPLGAPVASLGPFTYTFAAGANNLSYDVGVPSGGPDKLDVRVSARQPAGSGAFTTDSEANAVERSDVTVTNITPTPGNIYDATVGTGTFVVVATYDADMAGAPTIAFNPALATTLTFTGGAWSDGDGGGPLTTNRYTATYNVLDAGVKVDNVDITVTGGNSGGKAPVPFTQADAVDVDTTNPTVLSVVPSQALLTDADVGSDTFTVAVTYSQAMDATGANNPTIAFTPAVGGTLSAPTGTSAWSGAGTVYTASYDVSDANVNEPVVDSTVTAAVDATTANAQVAYTTTTAPEEFAIDTLTPRVLGAVYTNNPIARADIGAAGFTIAVTYSENMLNTGAADPTIAFTPDVTIGNLTFTGGVWTGATIYTATYDVADGTPVEDVDVAITGARNAADTATQLAYNEADAFDIRTKTQVNLGVDWNLFSHPLVPADTDIDVVLGGLGNEVLAVWYCPDPTGAPTVWQSWAPGPGGDLATIEDGKSYWIDMNTAQTLNLEGTVQPAPPTLPRSYPVAAGWNMTGFKSSTDPVTVTDGKVYLGNAIVNITQRMYRFNNAAQTWLAVNLVGVDNLIPGEGFWLSTTTAGTIYP